MKKSLRRAFSIVSWQTALVVSLALISTHLCLQFDIKADFPLTLIATAVIFPIVFSIGGAYKRRESALDQYAAMKAHGSAIFYAARDWPENPSPECVEKIRKELVTLLNACRTLFMGRKRDMTKHEPAVYESFSRLSQLIRTQLRENGLASGEVSRCNQYFSKMLGSFERIKHIFQYRTPRTLRAFSEVFITLLPPLYGPYFAAMADDFTVAGLVYIVPALFAFILTSLDNIQIHLEDPFDQIGEDDVSINVEKFDKRLASQSPISDNPVVNEAFGKAGFVSTN
ncbi:MAG: hypothetical protein KJN99_00060 [Marinicaulis sp.]|nr:hypothetical protein [Marinicaulis sp.]